MLYDPQASIASAGPQPHTHSIAGKKMYYLHEFVAASAYLDPFGNIQGEHRLVASGTNMHNVLDHYASAEFNQIEEHRLVETFKVLSEDAGGIVPRQTMIVAPVQHSTFDDAADFIRKLGSTLRVLRENTVRKRSVLLSDVAEPVWLTAFFGASD